MPRPALQLDAFLPYRLSYTANLVSEHVARAYEAQFGIDIAQWRVLSWVAQSGLIAQQDICLRTRMDKVTISRAAIALTHRGLVERRRNPADGRSHLLSLTAQGEALFDRIAPRARALEAEIFDRFDKEEIAAFLSMLRTIDEIVLNLEDKGPHA